MCLHVLELGRSFTSGSGGGFQLYYMYHYMYLLLYVTVCSKSLCYSLATVRVFIRAVSGSLVTRHVCDLCLPAACLSVCLSACMQAWMDGCACINIRACTCPTSTVVCIQGPTALRHFCLFFNFSRILGLQAWSAPSQLPQPKP